MFKDILLPLTTHPRPAGRATLRRALEAARLMEAHVGGLVMEPTIPLPVSFRPYGSELESRIDARRAEIREAAASALAAFQEEARRAGLSHDGQIVTVPDGAFDPVVEHARLRGLTIAPFIGDDEIHADLLQALIFETGRPLLLLPEDDGETFRLGRVVLAWDFSRAATRALADALPLLRQARDVRIVTVLADKPAPTAASGEELVAHLARNGVHATFDEIERGRRSVADVLDDAAEGADLMVMGAFGHSRLRDFLLGGATRHMLAKPRLPTFLSH